MNRVLSSLLALMVVAYPGMGWSQEDSNSLSRPPTGSPAGPPGQAGGPGLPSGGGAAGGPGLPGAGGVAQPGQAGGPAAGGASNGAFQGLELVDGRTVPGKVTESKPGAYAIVERADGKREAVEWSRIKRIDGKEPPPVPPPGDAGLIPEGFSPEKITKLADAGKKASELLPGLFAPKSSGQMIGSIKGAQDLLEAVGLKRGPPSPFFAAYPMFMMPLCFEMSRGTVGRVDGTGAFGAGCTYFLVPLSLGLLVAGPFLSLLDETEELKGTTTHHLDLSVYALDYQKKSALTGSFAREPSGGILGNNLGYDLGYTYIHPRWGVMGYGHFTLQQTSIARSDYLQVSSAFVKADAQVGLDAVRLLSGGKKDSYWSQHTAFFRIGPSFFHNWILSRDVSAPGAGASVDNPLNNSIPLVTGGGYELAAEVDFRFPELFGWSLGGVHFKFERGSYPGLSFPDLNPREGAFIAVIGFDDLRQGDSYTWQRLKLELELPINYSRSGGLYLGGQLVSYENNFGSGVDNRGLSLDYRYRWQ
ncbi:hypothetical protein [Chondromyces apiculatus]|uniref:Uncharacterized protein n=1 Tax=Chondromyces apiculatus DSM 436 TaxID=1192034 RepID=A0A017TEF4_9BACT|nr:hypothetical protein [Chondromyces apiculatus]EYF07205.1 Hypothetical protein CAP_0684 [Chondromyces apiculatus DSM 436]